MTTVFRNGNPFCTRCGSEYKMKVPTPVSEFTKKLEAFNFLHEDCEQTWEEPNADMSESVHKRAMWWISGGGERGMSSETMWNCFMGNEDFRISHPYDPDDFRRCYKLLEVIPEWKERLPELKKLSKPWSNLADNWDKLNEYLEEQFKTNEANGMYQFMETLIIEEE